MLKLGYNYKIPINEFRLNISKCFTSSYTETGSVYVHWPYCKKRCSYCNFNKFIHRENTHWSFSDTTIEDAMVREVECILDETPIRNVTSVFFGGGTPSLAKPRMVEKILSAVGRKCSLSRNVEVTLEANPSMLEAEKLGDFKLSGVNRLSLGVQSLRDDVLLMLNRDHTATEALHCLEKAKKIFGQKVSLDFIFGLPYQSVQMWENDLASILQHCDDHLSLYQLTIERGTLLFKQVEAGTLPPCPEDVQAQMYESALSLCTRHGLTRYEVSNFARTPSAQSSHNKAVWQGGQYVGVGPGAHSRVVVGGRESGRTANPCLKDGEREARINAMDPRSWLAEVKKKGNGARKVERQTRAQMQMEYIATSLRTVEGADPVRWGAFSPVPLEEAFPAPALKDGYLVFEDGRLRATPVGINVLDTLLPSLLLLIPP